VVTAGGLLGRVADLDEQHLFIEIASGVESASCSAKPSTQVLAQGLFEIIPAAGALSGSALLAAPSRRYESLSILEVRYLRDSVADWGDLHPAQFFWRGPCGAGVGRQSHPQSGSAARCRRWKAALQVGRRDARQP
jgi:hypothetical protein